MAKQTSILVVDDDIKLCETLADILREKGYTVDLAHNGNEAEEKLTSRFFNIALLDVKLPDVEGTELLRKLKIMYPATEVIVITGYATLESSITALREGAFAYVIKPMAMDEVIATIEQAVQRQRLLFATSEQLIKERQGKEYYKLLSITDGLTELCNYRYFQELLTREIGMAKRYAHQVSLMIIDTDNLKQHNDTYGHLAGDKALRNIAKMLKASCRAVDVVARYGGDEFAIVMPYTNKEGAVVAAERLRRIIDKDQAEPRLTISIGVASYPLDAEDQNQLISCADQALYEAKSKRNTVCSY